MSSHLLAINDGHDAGAALFSGDELVAAASRERFTRKKFHGGFPEEVVAYLLDKYDLTLDDIQDIAVCNRHHFVYRLFQKQFAGYSHTYLDLKQKMYSAFHHMLAKSQVLSSLSAALNRKFVQRSLGKRVVLVDHHTAHAASAYFTSGFPDALAVTMDHLGDGYAAGVFDCRNGRCRFLYGSTPLHSPGQFYGEITEFLGFNPLKHAGKITGLAAYGDPQPAYPLLKKFFSYNPKRKDFSMPFMLTRSFRSRIYRELGPFRREDVAAGLQRCFEEAISAYVLQALETTDHHFLVLAGGVFGNVKLNQRLMALEKVRQIYIHPAMNDSGLAVGAGLHYLSGKQDLRPAPMPTVYLGPAYTEVHIASVLADSGLPFKRCESVAEETAALLTKGKVVARFSGRMEYGPRALGNRSILVSAVDPSINQALNRRLDRTEFMPFAPTILEEFADRCLAGREKAYLTSRFMNITFDCTPWMIEKAPAVVHVDGTARPQILREQDNPSYYAVCKNYYERTGIPVIINTSFNMHEEPIVRTPEDALRAFRQGCADYLTMENFLVSP